MKPFKKFKVHMIFLGPKKITFAVFDSLSARKSDVLGHPRAGRASYI